MNSFLKSVLATVTGIFLSIFIMFVLAVINIFVVVSALGTSEKVEDNSVFVLNLQGIISEHSESNPLGALTRDDMNNIGLNEVLSAIDKAETNEKIKGIYLETGVMETDYATLQEIRNRLEKFKKSKKWIISYSDQYTQGAYYLSSVADKMFLNPDGGIDWRGLSSQPEYYRDLMAKFGVKMQVVKVGTYKSYTETYTEDRMSDANREQVTTYLKGLWNVISESVSKSRNIELAKLNQYADSLCVFSDPQVLKERKMIDDLFYADQIREYIKKRLGIDSHQTIPQLTLADMKNLDSASFDDGGQIAVYYCEGGIVMNPTMSVFASGDGIVAANVCKDLEALASDDDVKAVVLRINSGGGDAYASEQLWRSISLLKKKKPVVVSMGGAAASGGYYMSCNASWIVAQPSTITGSIGIFGAFPDFSGLFTEKLGIHFDEVKTNANSSFNPVGLARPMNDSELAYMQSFVNRGYDTFLTRVADGRKMKKEDVNKIAQGRVWLGSDAINIGLVDQLGGLSDAVSKAAKLANQKDFYVKDYPSEDNFLNALMGKSSKNSYLDEQLHIVLGPAYEPFGMIYTIKEQSPVQARMPMVYRVSL